MFKNQQSRGQQDVISADMNSISWRSSLNTAGSG